MNKGYLYLGILIFLILTHTGVYFYGQKVEGDARDSKELELVLEKIEEGKRIAKEEFSFELVAANAEWKRKLDESARNKRIIKEIQTNTIYSDVTCNLPDGGMRIWNDENRGYSKPTTSETDGEMREGTPRKNGS